MVIGSIAAILLGVLASAAVGQAAPARLAIEVRDSTRGAIAGVTVVIVDQSTGLTRRGTTDTDGVASFPALPAGIYGVTATIAGFKTEIIREIRLAAGVQATLPITLKPGSFTEQVVVIADAATLRIGSGAVAGRQPALDPSGATRSHAALSRAFVRAADRRRAARLP